MKYYFWKPKNYIKREYSSKNTKDIDNKDIGDTLDNKDIGDTVDNKDIGYNNDICKSRENNKKNELNDKLNERVLMKQTIPNPFFINSNYIDDLDTQNKFLR